MQRKLSEIAEIPKILSCTLQTVSQTFDKFLPPETEVHRQDHQFGYDDDNESGTQDDLSDDEDDVISDVDSLEFRRTRRLIQHKDSTPESDYISEGEVEYEEIDDEDDDDDEEEDDDFEINLGWGVADIPEVKIETPEPTEEELLKLEKQEKINKLERSWPWADREKVIYKQSTCHLVPRKPTGIVENRIKQLKEQNLLSHLDNNQND